MEAIFTNLMGLIWIILGVFTLLILVLPSIRIIGPTEVGLVTKRFSRKSLSEGNPIAFNGEAGYQSDLLMPGWRFKFWILFSVKKFPWVQIPAGQIGVVIAQIGQPLVSGAKSAVYKNEFGNFTDLSFFVNHGGQKGVQRPVLPPGTLLPLHPVAFLVITKNETYGLPVSSELKELSYKGPIKPDSFGLDSQDLDVFRIEPEKQKGTNQIIDMVGIVTTYEGDPLPPGSIAGRLGGFEDIAKLEADDADNSSLIETVLGSKNSLHNNYQNFQAFLDAGGKIGLQHDPLLYGAYTLNPFLVSVEKVPMLVIEQGQVAVVKSYVGLPSDDTSGTEFKFGTLVKPGHMGIWEEPIRTGKYPINPHCYLSEIVPTCILTLNWAEAVSQAHNLDQHLKSIIAKSREGFVFTIDLQVQIHVADTQAPRVISIVGTMRNLVNEVLQAAVGNHFRDKLQSLSAVTFIETRQQVQEEARAHIEGKLKQYMIETIGVYIQDVILPEELIKVLTNREIANQEKETYVMQEQAQVQRIRTENARGLADMQAQLAQAQVGVDIKTNGAKARMAEADGESTYIQKIGTAKGAEIESVGLAKAKGYREQVSALGQGSVAIITVAENLSKSGQRFVPEVLVAGGNSSGMDGIAATLMQFLHQLSTGSKTVASTEVVSANKPAEPVVSTKVEASKDPVTSTKDFKQEKPKDLKLSEE